MAREFSKDVKKDKKVIDHAMAVEFDAGLEDAIAYCSRLVDDGDGTAKLLELAQRQLTTDRLNAKRVAAGDQSVETIAARFARKHKNGVEITPEERARAKAALEELLASV